MKVSPIEIRQKTFEKNFRGYDKEEVDAFLLSLSQEWERVMEEVKETKIKLQQAEKEIHKLREVETTLYKTLKTAEDTGANIVGQANKSAELLTKEARINSESILNDARTQSKNIIEEAEEKSKNVLFEAQKKLNEIALEIQSLEKNKQNLAHDLRQLGQDVIDRANRISSSVPLPDYGKLLAKEEAPSMTAPIIAKKEELPPAEESKPIQENEVETQEAEQSNAEAGSGSFFDQID
jgi:cell division initiation protein